MNPSITSEKIESKTMTTTELLEHWQGHRRLTRKLIEAFPEDEFFTFTIGGMRPFADMVMELLAIAGPGIREIATSEPAILQEKFEHGNKKSRLLELWDETTATINALWSQVAEGDFSQKSLAFGQYEGTTLSHILYFIDNEVHHRGQAYVYLRALGITPPFFWERD